MADFTVDENGVAYDNRQRPLEDLPKSKRESEFEGSGWWIVIAWLLCFGLILAAVVVDKPIVWLEDCSGPDCTMLPITFLILLCALSGMFSLKPNLAHDLKELRYVTAGLLFILLIDFGHAGILNAYGNGHYVVATINKITRKILRTSEPSDSAFFSIVYLLSPFPLFFPDIIRVFRKLLSK